MKKSIFTVVLLSILISLYTMANTSNQNKVDEPDFNYPQDVLAQAQKEMETYAANCTEVGQPYLNALLKGLRAIQEVEPRNIEGQLKFIRRYTDEAKLSDADRALVLALEAKLLREYYGANDWRIDAREVPGDSVTLWNGQQFKDTIASLYGQAYSLAANIDVAQYIPKVLTPGDTTIFNTFDQLLYSWFEPSDSIYKQCEVGTPAYFYWLLKSMRHDYEHKKRIIDTYREYSAYEWANLLLFCINNNPTGVDLGTTYDNENNQEHDAFVEVLKEALKAHPKFPYNGYLKGILKKFTAPTAEIKIRSYVAVGNKFSFTVYTYNGKEIELALCEVPSLKWMTKEVAELPALQEYTWRPDSGYDSRVFEAEVSSPGIYIIRSRFKGQKRYESVSFEATPFVPMVIYQGSEGVAITTDYLTGAPFEKVSVVGRGDTTSTLGRTNAEGMLRFANWQRTNSWNQRVTFRYKGHSYSFDDDLRVGFERERTTSKAYRLNILTDRAIYHQGETISWVVVAGQRDVSGKKSPLVRSNVQVTFYDANHKALGQLNVETDAFGRAEGAFDIPADQLTGAYTLTAKYGNESTSTRVMVSDFKAPVFEVKIDSVEMSPTRVVLKGLATTLSGMPVVDARVELDVKYAYRWSGSETLAHQTATTDAEGRFAFTIEPDGWGTPDDRFSAEVSVTTAAAEVASATRTFCFHKQYSFTIKSEMGNISTAAPFKFTADATDINGSSTEVEYVWKLTDSSEGIVKEGKAISGKEVVLNVENLKAGDYFLSVAAFDDSNVEGDKTCYTFYNIDKQEVPEKSMIFVPKHDLMAPTDADSSALVVGTPHDYAYIYVVVSNQHGIQSVKNYKIQRGYTSIPLPLYSDKEHKVVVMGQKSGYTVREVVEISRVKPEVLRIEVETFRDRLVPGSTETWRLRIVGRDAASAAAVATMYNKALDQLVGFNGQLSFQFAEPGFNIGISDISTYIKYTNLVVKYSDLQRPAFVVPGFAYILGYKNTIMIRGYSSLTKSEGNHVLSEASVNFEAPMAMSEEDEDAAALTDGIEGAAVEEALPEVEYREAEVLQAFWRPRLVADKEGVVTIEFTVPNANTTWAFHMFGWTADLLSARLDATALASKPVMVQSAMPRFLRQGDSATLRATVFNNSDSAATISTEFEIFNPADGKTIEKMRKSLTIAPKASEIISAPVSATPNLGSVGYRVKAISGNYSDGEQYIIPILASSQMVVESQEFYLDAQGDGVTIDVPKADDAVSTFQYCQNPIWTVVKAMRGVEWENYSFTTSIATQLGSASMVQHIVRSNPRITGVLAQWKANPDGKALSSMLEKNDDLKTLLLDQTPWVQAAQSNTERMNNLVYALDSTRCDYVYRQSKAALEKLQNADGGFRWATWCKEESSVWVTSYALHILGVANSFKALPGDFSAIVRRAFRYVEAEAVADSDREWLHMQYALLATLYPSITPSTEGQKLIEDVCSRLIMDWRTMDLNDKSYTAMILNAHNHSEEARAIIASIAQYGKEAPGRGMEFPSVRDMRTYGSIIQAVAAVTPGNPILDLMRQWVILQAQATDDLGACNPDYIIASVLLTGTPWMDMTSVQPIRINGEAAMFTEAELGTGYFTTKVAPGTSIEVNPTGVTPSYGSVVSVFSQPMKDVPAFKTSDLEISKRMMVQRDGKWVESRQFRHGEEVKIQLQIRAKRQLEYVAITDERAAAFEPVDQLPGWIWSDGIGFYRENRDASTRLFIGYLPKGSYSLTYSMTAATTGTFASGVATLQSQYDPALTAHSSGMMIEVFE